MAAPLREQAGGGAEKNNQAGITVFMDKGYFQRPGSSYDQAVTMQPWVCCPKNQTFRKIESNKFGDVIGHSIV